MRSGVYKFTQNTRRTAFLAHFNETFCSFQYTKKEDNGCLRQEKLKLLLFFFVNESHLFRTFFYGPVFIIIYSTQSIIFAFRV